MYIAYTQTLTSFCVVCSCVRVRRQDNRWLYFFFQLLLLLMIILQKIHFFFKYRRRTSFVFTFSRAIYIILTAS